jgi:hypothetical protein
MSLTLQNLTDFGLIFPSDAITHPGFSRSHLLNMLYTFEFAKRIENITAVVVSPGYVASTGIPLRHLRYYVTLLHLPPFLDSFYFNVLKRIQQLTWRRPDQAALIYLYAAVAPPSLLPNGSYLDSNLRVHSQADLAKPQTSELWSAAAWAKTSRMMAMYGTWSDLCG